MTEINKKALSERDICTKYITPAIANAGWDVFTQLREEAAFTAGKIMVKGKTVKRGKPKRADYILYFKPNIPLAIIEAKDNNHSVGAGMQQALGYSDSLEVPFVFSSNGDGFVFHDKTVIAGDREKEISLDAFPLPAELWQRCCAWKGIQPDAEKIVAQDYYVDSRGKEPRYYQVAAVNRTVEAIARGQHRNLLVMATGTGKTYTAFQIIWRLWKAGIKKRILFLADRNILVDQAKTNDFSPFGGALTKITHRQVDKAAEFLKRTNRYDKTIVFCEDIEHAERMRQALVNENSDLVAEDRRYCMRITGDNDEGKLELDNFIDPESKYPVIVTTSKLLSTGVDTQTCKLIVLDQTINSPAEFKQIIGRGTRVKEEYGKLFFTIMDFKKATELFADPDFDGPPISVYKPGPDDPPVPPDDPGGVPGPADEGEELPPNIDIPPPEGGTRRKRYVDDVSVMVVSERAQYYGPDGKLITESLKDYTRKRVAQEYASLDDFIQKWKAADKKQVIVDELGEQGVFFEALTEQVGKDLDPFDTICHVVFGQPPLTRKERAENVRKRNYFTKYGDQARAVLDALLDKCADDGIQDIENPNVLNVEPIRSLGTPVEIIRAFGGKQQYEQAIRELQQELYGAA